MIPRRRIRATATIVEPVLIAIAATIIILSVRNLALFASNADVLDLAASLERGSPRPDANYLSEFVKTRGLDRPSTDCSDSFTRATLTVNLVALEAANKQGDPKLIDVAETNALHAAAHRLDCNPLDGNAWLQHAIVSARIQGPAASVVGDLRQSYRTAPYEGWILPDRLALASNLYLAGGTGFETEYFRDLRRFASLESEGTVASAYVETPPRVRILLHGLIELQPAKRRKDIVAEIDRLGVDFSRQ